MKAAQEMTKEELVSFVYNNLNVDITEKIFECASCGDEPNAKFYYVCDKCNEVMIDDD